MDPLDRRDRLIRNTLQQFASEADKAASHVARAATVARQNRFKRRRRKVPFLERILGFIIDFYWFCSGFCTREYACCVVRIGYGLIMLFLLFSLALINLNNRRLEKELIEAGAIEPRTKQVESGDTSPRITE